MKNKNLLDIISMQNLLNTSYCTYTMHNWYCHTQIQVFFSFLFTFHTHLYAKTIAYCTYISSYERQKSTIRYLESGTRRNMSNWKYLLIFWLYLTTYLYNYYPLISKAAKGVKQAFQSCWPLAWWLSSPLSQCRITPWKYKLN